ncbi:C-X-C motif chemokine 2-like [Nannospalax galili]|uniref:C-X-C motif chemokine n=1 Tax=Nannospalax galili TaxID=1026970 RepID=A0A8C6WAM0_NANGA|nr:C-X-C motif chemokine 2-like [Nannospalax galili]
MVRAAGVPLLRSALLLLLLLATSQTTGAPVAAELRCQCLQTVQGIQLKSLQSVRMTPPGAHCSQTEVIATLKDGREVCLDPEAPMVQKIIQRILSKNKAN